MLATPTSSWPTTATHGRWRGASWWPTSIASTRRPRRRTARDVVAALEAGTSTCRAGGRSVHRSLRVAGRHAGPPHRGSAHGAVRHPPGRPMGAPSEDADFTAEPAERQRSRRLAARAAPCSTRTCRRVVQAWADLQPAARAAGGAAAGPGRPARGPRRCWRAGAASRSRSSRAARTATCTGQALVRGRRLRDHRLRGRAGAPAGRAPRQELTPSRCHGHGALVRLRARIGAAQSAPGAARAGPRAREEPRRRWTQGGDRPLPGRVSGYRGRDADPAARRTNSCRCSSPSMSWRR